MRQEEVRWTPLLHIHRVIWDHECPHTCSSSLQVTPGVMQRCSPTPSWKWDIAFPERMSALANAFFHFWAAMSLKVRPTFKGFGLLTVGKLWLGHRLCSSPGRSGSASEIRVIAADQPTESEVLQICPSSGFFLLKDEWGKRAKVLFNYLLHSYSFLVFHSCWPIEENVLMIQS